MSGNYSTSNAESSSRHGHRGHGKASHFIDSFERAVSKTRLKSKSKSRRTSSNTDSLREPARDGSPRPGSMNSAASRDNSNSRNDNASIYSEELPLSQQKTPIEDFQGFLVANTQEDKPTEDRPVEPKEGDEQEERGRSDSPKPRHQNFDDSKRSASAQPPRLESGNVPTTNVIPASPDTPVPARTLHDQGILSSFITAASSAAQAFLNKTPEHAQAGDSTSNPNGEVPPPKRPRTMTEPPKPSLLKEKPIRNTIGTGTLTLDDVEKIGHESPQGTRDDRSFSDPAQLNSQDAHSPVAVSVSDSTRRKRNSSVGRASGRPLSFVSDGVDSQHRVPGFAVASAKRNKEFHSLFRSVPEDDYLIEDYGAALHKEILVHGRFYVSEGHVCFNSNIFGWLIIAFEEIVSIEKKSTAVVFPNALQISTLHAKHVFASFISRDSTYDLVVSIWKLTHPSSRATPNGMFIAERDSNSDASTNVSENESADESDENGSRVIQHGNDDEAFQNAVSDSSADEYDHEGGRAANGDRSASAGRSKSRHKKSEGSGENGNGLDVFSEQDSDPQKHGPTVFSGQQLEKPLADEVVPLSLPKVFQTVFGSDDSWIIHFLEKVQGVHDVNLGAWESEGSSAVRKSSYVRPLSGPVGPKQTTCNITETLSYADFLDHIELLVTTATPDVPSGNAFLVKTKYILTWAKDNGTRIQTSCSIEWSKSSWLKSAVEKGASEGQIQYSKDLINELQKLASSKAGGKKKGKAGKRKTKSGTEKDDAEKQPAKKEGTAAGSGGLFSMISPITDMIRPVTDTLQPVFGSNIIIKLVLIFVVYQTWSLNHFVNNIDNGTAMAGAPARSLTSRWQAEEELLWQWMDARGGFASRDESQLRSSGSSFLNRLEKPSLSKRQSWSPHDMPSSKGMSHREILEAVRMTEDKLKALKVVLDKK